MTLPTHWRALIPRFVQKNRTISAGTGLTGGGDLSADRTIDLDTTYPAIAARTSGYQGFLHDGSIYTSRRLFNCETNVGLASFGTMTQDRWYIVPGVVPDEIDAPTLVGLGFEVTTGAAGFGYMAVWTSTNGYADAVLVNTLKLDVSAAGFAEDTGLGLALLPGQKVWVGVAVDVAGVVCRGVSVNAQAACLSRGAAGATNHVGGFYYDGTAGAGPDPFPAPTGSMTGIAVPAIHGMWS